MPRQYLFLTGERRAKAEHLNMDLERIAKKHLEQIDRAIQKDKEEKTAENVARARVEDRDRRLFNPRV